MAAEACESVREKTGVNVCALTGGVFQNRLLAAMTADLLRNKGFRVLLHGMLPPNDGGICAGQALAAMYHLNNPKHSSILKQGDGLCV
jgi:hydrogenase maturation protein HypF